MTRNGTFGNNNPMRTSSGAVVRPKAIQRTSAGLRDALFDAIEKVRDGELDSDQAKAIGNLAGQICNTVSLEIEVAKLRTEYPADTKLVLPAPLPLGEPTIAEKPE